MSAFMRSFWSWRFSLGVRWVNVNYGMPLRTLFVVSPMTICRWVFWGEGWSTFCFGWMRSYGSICLVVNDLGDGIATVMFAGGRREWKGKEGKMWCISLMSQLLPFWIEE